MMDRQQKLKELVDKVFGGNQAQFAKTIKRSPAQVNHWLTGHRNLGDAGARHIEMSLNLGMGFFDESRGMEEEQVLDTIQAITRPAYVPRRGRMKDQLLEDFENNTYDQGSHYSKAPPARPEIVPVLHWMEVLFYAFDEPEFNPDALNDWVPVFEREVNPQTFGVRVDNDSMKCSGPFSFDVGDIVIYKPYLEYKSLDFIISIDLKTKEPSFKQLIIDAGRWFLKSLNPDYPLISTSQDNIKIVGKVFQKVNITNIP